MIVRALDENNDWTFGYSNQNYLTNLDAIAQNIKTRLREYLGDCFFNLGAGIAWNERLGRRGGEELLKSDTYRIIKNTDGVLGILEHELIVKERVANIRTTVQTQFGKLLVEVANG